MEKTIKRVEFPAPRPVKVTRVAAYARVSTGKDAMLHSLAAQVSYYSEFIHRHPDWVYCGVYADEALSGTKDDRANFQRLMAACRNGEVDLVITKSISRLARNTVTLLETVRELKELSVDVYFEEQNIHTLSSEGELMLTILASYAQEESRSASENQKWRIKKNFEEGLPWDGTLLGYRYKGGEYVIEPMEAETVRRIYREYLSGKGTVAIANGLNADGVKTRFGNAWHKERVAMVLRNYTYTGNLLLQKTYRENHLTKKMLINNGELPKYHVADAHEAIISLDDYIAVQEEIKRRAAKHAPPPDSGSNRYPFSGLIVCSRCGKHYRRKTKETGPVWICPTYNFRGKAACPSKAIPENTLETLAADIALNEVAMIRAEDGNRVVFCLKNGTEITKEWQDRSRRESWTPEMREAARQKYLERHSKAQD